MVSAAGNKAPRYHPAAEPAHVRASDAQRDTVAAMVRDALADGRLELGEIDERISAVYDARTHGDLAAVVHDLTVMASTPAPGAAWRPGTSNHTIVTMLVLCLFLGVFGAHRFHAGKADSGLAMLILGTASFGVVSGLWAIVDLVVIAGGRFHDGQGRVICQWRLRPRP